MSPSGGLAKPHIGVILSVALVFCFLGTISLLVFSSLNNNNGDQMAPQIHWLQNSLQYPPSPSSSPSNDDDDDCTTTTTNISHIVFGIGGSVVSWPERSRYSKLWWVPNKTRGYVWLDAAPPCNVSWPQTPIPYRVSSSHVTKAAAARLSRILLESYKLELPNVRWFVMGDDDTIFFPDNLVAVLARYDHRKMWYIGCNSESVEQDAQHGFGMAFGGGGFAISYPLAVELVNILDGCLARYHSFYGSDERIRSCISEVGVKLTTEPGFHQMDIRGNPYGLLVAHPLASLVSLHHIETVEPIFPHLTKFDSIKTLMRPYQADPLRTLQQSFCYHRTLNWSIAVSWGYSILIYPSLITPDLLEIPLQTFKTWSTFRNGPFTFQTRNLGTHPCAWPVFFFLDQVYRHNATSLTLTTYNISQTVERESPCKSRDYMRLLQLKTIQVSSHKMKPQDWTQAPRRQCCEIVETNHSGRRMEINLRKCRPRETITI